MTDPKQEPILTEELEFYNSQKANLLKEHEGKFVLIKNTRLIGAYKSEAEAYVAGLKQLGNVPFLIKLVAAKEEAVWIPIANT